MAATLARFAPSLDILIIFLTYWSTYRKKINLNFNPPCSCIFIKHFNLCFTFRPFPTVDFILHSWTYVGLYFMWVVCDDAPLSPNHYSSSYFSLFLETSLDKVTPTKSLSISSSLYFFLSQQVAYMRPLFPHLWHSPFNRLPLPFLLFQKSAAL